MAERNLDFDTVIDRHNTGCLKYDFAAERGKPADVLPLWVADMDFRTSSYVEDALIERVHHGIFGYSEVKWGGDYFKALHDWYLRYHHFSVKPEWIVKTPGVVYALATAVKAFTEAGDAVMIQQPVYYPFSEVIRDNGRRIVSSDLQLGPDNRYHIDLEDFERKVSENQVKLFLLCSPHNPVGRVFTREELTALGNICLRHHVIVVSDEIHSDIVFEGEHTVFASISPALASISVICTSPSKTFNLAGLLISNIFIPDRELRHAFKAENSAAGIGQLSPLGLVAAQAAYEHGGEWYAHMMEYVKGNIDYIRDFTEKNLPGVRMISLEGTYLPWLDFRKTGIDAEELDRRIVYDAKLWLDSGRIFGRAGEGFQRINAAAPRSVIEECMKRLRKVL